MGIHMIFPYRFNKADKQVPSMPSTPILIAVSAVIAVIAALMGIGGGVLLIPFLSWCGLQMRKAIGFSSVSGVFIALFGSASYVLSGWNVSGLPEWSLGYVYLPAFLGSVMTSVLIAPLGVKAASIWPTKILKRIFAFLLVVVGLKLAIA